MRFSFRLAEILGHEPNPRKRPGTVKTIVEHTGLDRHQVAALLKNEVKYIPLQALSRLCDYLIEHGYVAADQLPGALFAVEPEDFWELLARRQRFEVCLGVRQPNPEHEPEGAWVVASDSLLLGELLNGVSTLGGTAKHQREKMQRSEEHSAPVLPHPENVKQSLVWAPQQSEPEAVIERAREVYADFNKVAGDKALVCLGSIKSNPVAELVLGQTFGGEPFKSEDNVAKATDRSCPFMFRYRDQDPQPPGCSGGTQLSASEPAELPGIYYEKADGSWGVCPWEPGKTDAALVFYIHRESQGRLEMQLGGFSGRATRLLARMLATQAAEFWPPIYDNQGLRAGVFVVQFNYSGTRTSSNILREDQIAGHKIIKLEPEVLARRLEPTQK
jgi:hypothetical protein